jgi:hypothetical protein
MNQRVAKSPGWYGDKMKPGQIIWASNDDYAGGPDIGSPTKAPYSASQLADGYERNLIVSAQKWNYWRNSIAEKLKRHEAKWVKSWMEASNTQTVNNLQPTQGAYCPAQGMHFIPNPGTTSDDELYSFTNGRYLLGAAIGVGNGVLIDAFDTGANDVRVMMLNANDKLAYSSAGGAWTIWTGVGALGVSFHKGHYDNIGRYCFLMKTSCDIYTTTSTGTVPSSTDTQFAAGEPCKLLHTRHPSGKIYPDDAGNQIWLALTPTEVNTSADGVTWGTPSSHGVSNVDEDADLAYSAYGARWIIMTPGISGGLGTIAISDDNGSTWTSYNRLPYKNITSPLRTAIATDGFGTWVAGANESGPDDIEFFYSIDNGDTWSNLYLPFDGKEATLNNPCIYYGGGQFNIAVDVGSGVTRFFHSLTIED